MFIDNKEINEIINKSYDIDMIQKKKEIIDFIDFLQKEKVHNVLEIGTDKSRLFYIWCKISDGIKIFLDFDHADFSSTFFSMKERSDKIIKWGDNINIIKDNSHNENIFMQVLNILGDKKLDLLFIDGDHSYYGVKKDFDMYSSIVKEDGLIAFYNILFTDNHRDANCYVGSLWSEIEGDKREFVTDDIWGGIGVLRKNSNLRIDRRRMFYIPSVMNGVNVVDGLLDLAKNYCDKHFTVAEIGSFSGVSTEVFARFCRRVYAIDRWEKYDGISEPIDFNEVELLFDEVVKKFPNIIKCKGDSFDVFRNFPDEMFDLIYIDASHDVLSVKRDINNWLPKIKKDGIICGHDYTHIPDVKMAVDEIFFNCFIHTFSDSSWLVNLKEYYGQISF